MSFTKNVHYDEPVCKLVAGENARLWNIDWISSSDLKNALDVNKAVSKNVLESLESVIPSAEVELFITKAADGYYS